MRRLAERLGVTPMALYNHFGNKEELTRRVAEAVLDEFTGPGEVGEWDDRLRACFVGIRGVCLSHPNAVPLIETMEVGSPALFRPMEAALSALDEAGFAPAEAMNAYCGLIAFTMGHVSYQLRGTTSFDPAAAIQANVFSAEDFPHVVRTTTALADWDFDSAFLFGLDVILDGLRSRAPR
jgi:TetR/AcrR family transcriptional regulator, tetracycline repressor protein